MLFLLKKITIFNLDTKNNKTESKFLKNQKKKTNSNKIFKIITVYFLFCYFRVVLFFFYTKFEYIC